MRSWRTSEIADGALWLAVILAPVAGGSAHVAMMPVLAAIVSVAYVASLVEHQRSGSRVYLFGLPVGLFALAAYTMLQVLPLPSGLLGLISPRAGTIRELFDPSFAPISYEPAASAREAARLCLYAMVALTAADRARARRSFDVVAIPVVIAGIASLAVAAVQRLLGAERMLGVLPSMKEPSKLISTFVNPNHASAFLLLVAMTALGQSISETESAARRYTFAAAGVIAGVGSALCFSRGGLAALALSLVVFLALSLRHSAVARDQRGKVATLVGVCGAVALGAVLVHFDELVHAFSVTETDPLGVAPKIAAVKDALPLAIEHPLLGIGRGAYVSVYPGYKTAAYQLTFTHAENIAAQLIADWGILAGGAALLGLVSATLTRIRTAPSPAVLAATATILVVTAQNLVDFNLELPGMAIPVAALLGGATQKVTSFRRVWPREVKLLLLLGAAPVVTSIVGTALGLAGDLDVDQQHFDLAVRERRLDRSTRGASDHGKRVLPIEELLRRAERHPANAVMAAQLSYLAETAEPPDHARALRWANRALLLAPTYADAHLSVGRMLVHRGHRAQGFMHMRRGLALASEDRRPTFIRHAAAMAHSAEELEEALPRRDEALDVLDEAAIAPAARELAAMGREDWAKLLLSRINPTETPSDRLVEVASAAAHLGELELASSAAARRLAEHPADDRAARVLLDVSWKQKDTARLNALLDQILARPEIDPTPFLELRVRAAVEEGRVDVARSALDLLHRRMSPTLANQVLAARLEAVIETKDGQAARAVRALDRAVQLSPTDTKLRYTRARALAGLGRVTEARADLQQVLRANPSDRAAASLLERLERRQPGESRPEEDVERP